ncbi:pseudoazurin [Rhizobiaceae bacterium BDR2-2]|uniref:Pseudoazurin n=1 Tax=Ectorhizobium quercum TaxID=2965071 RepID=A0AAE3N404_9HYPH|nr:pseudoazurin [Ectorhizobium quercum]MCX8999526.1 pseudoazurin [Ectorhizobium quercum]
MKAIGKQLAGAALLAMLAAPAFAAEHEIKMLNKGSDGETMVFEPSFLRIAPGDTVVFVPTDKSHQVDAVKEALPEGAEEFKGKLNQAVSVTLTIPGAYPVKCIPHLGMGMVGLIVVGDGVPDNLEQVKSIRLPKKSKDRLAADIAKAEAP